MADEKLPRSRRKLRREVAVLRDTKGVYVCGRCHRLIPLGFMHTVVNGTHCVVEATESRRAV